MEVKNCHQVCKVIVILGGFLFTVWIKWQGEEDILEWLGMEEISWSNGSVRKSCSMCPLEGERVWGRGSKNGSGVWCMGCIGKVGTTIGFGSKARGAG